MSLTKEDADFVANCRLRVLQNIQAGKVPEADIDEEKLKRAYEIIRKDRSLGAAGKGSKSKSKAEDVVPLDLNAFMGKK